MPVNIHCMVMMAMSGLINNKLSFQSLTYGAFFYFIVKYLPMSLVMFTSSHTAVWQTYGESAVSYFRQVS